MPRAVGRVGAVPNVGSTPRKPQKLHTNRIPGYAAPFRGKTCLTALMSWPRLSSAMSLTRGRVQHCVRSEQRGWPSPAPSLMSLTWTPCCATMCFLQGTGQRVQGEACLSVCVHRRVYRCVLRGVQVCVHVLVCAGVHTAPPRIGSGVECPSMLAPMEGAVLEPGPSLLTPPWPLCSCLHACLLSLHHTQQTQPVSEPNGAEAAVLAWVWWHPWAGISPGLFEDPPAHSGLVTSRQRLRPLCLHFLCSELLAPAACVRITCDTDAWGLDGGPAEGAAPAVESAPSCCPVRPVLRVFHFVTNPAAMCMCVLRVPVSVCRVCVSMSICCMCLCVYVDTHAVCAVCVPVCVVCMFPCLCVCVHVCT